MPSQAPESVTPVAEIETGSNPEAVDHAPSINMSDHCESNVDAHEDDASHMHISTFRLRVLKVGAKVAKHARYITIHACSSALPAWQRFLNHFKQLQ